jgi:hypothetical protein
MSWSSYYNCNKFALIYPSYKFGLPSVKWFISMLTPPQDGLKLCFREGLMMRLLFSYGDELVRLWCNDYLKEISSSEEASLPNPPHPPSDYKYCCSSVVTRIIVSYDYLLASLSCQELTHLMLNSIILLSNLRSYHGLLLLWDWGISLQLHTRLRLTDSLSLRSRCVFPLGPSHPLIPHCS